MQELIKDKALADKIKKLTATGVDEYEAVRRVIQEHTKTLLTKAEALKDKIKT